MPVNFQPSRIFVEYHSQFPLVSSEIRTVGLGLKIHIDTSYVWELTQKDRICLILAQNSQLHTH